MALYTKRSEPKSMQRKGCVDVWVTERVAIAHKTRRMKDVYMYI